MIKRLTSVIIVCTLLSCFLLIPASAADLSGTVRSEFYVSDNFTSWSTRTFDLNYPVSGQYTTITNGDWDYGALHNFLFNIGPISSNTVISLSYYFTCKAPSQVANSMGGISAFYLDTNGGSHNFTPTVGSFTPTSDANYPHACNGLQIVAQFDVETSSTEPPIPYPITIQRLFFDYKTHYVKTSDVDKDVGIKITSLQVIQTSASTAELNQLKDIAAGIAESNQILSAMYGDILAVCNSIYERTGDLLTAQNLTNQYFSSIIPVIESIKSTTDNIYTLLGQQFALLISTIQSESDDLQATINAAIDKMIAYLDNAFAGSVNPALPGQSTDIKNGSTTVQDSESGYQSTATERFDTISANFAGFDGSVLSGVALAGSLFQRLWNVLGDYVVVYTVPLVIAICLTILGRADRRGKKDNGSDSGIDRSSPDGLGGIPRLPGK